MRGTALCAAIEARSYDMTRYLLDSGCDVNARDFDGEPPLLLALRKTSSFQGHASTTRVSDPLSIVSLLINHPNCNLNKFDPITHTTALHLATTEGMVEVVSWLIESRSSSTLNFNVKDKDGNTPLHLATQTANVAIVELLTRSKNCLCTVNAGDQTFTRYPFNLAGLSCMHLCARNGNTDCMKLLLDRLCLDKKQHEIALLGNDKRNDSELFKNVNGLTLYERETCLHIACRNDHEELVKLLLRYGAIVNKEDSMDNTPLLLSLVSQKQWQSRSNNVPRVLLKAGADPNTKARMHHSRYIMYELEVTPLLIAALNDNVELARLLVTHGANVNDTDSEGRTALYTALWENSVQVALFLLRECTQINVNQKLRDGSTCLHALVKVLAREDSGVVNEMARHIFRHGGYISANNKEQTPVHTACEYGNHVFLDVILEVIDKGIYELHEDAVNVLMVNAAADALPEVIRVLLSHGAEIDGSETDGVESSCFYTLLRNSDFETAKFLASQGLDLRKYGFLKLQEVSPKNEAGKSMEETNANCESGDDTDEESNTTSSIDEFEDILHEIGDLRLWFKEIASSPMSLELLCLTYIRKYFRSACIPFKSMERLGLPEKTVKRLRYK